MVSSKKTGYFSNMVRIVQILWQAQPSFLVILLILTLFTGLLTPALLLVSSSIIDVLATALQAHHSSTALPQTLLLLLIALGSINVVGQVSSTLRSAIESLYQQRVTHFISLSIASRASTLDLSFFENPDFHNLLSNASAEASYRPVTIVTQMMTIVSTAITLVSMSIILLFWQAWIIPLVLGIAILRFLITVRLSHKRVMMLTKHTSLSRKAQYIGTLLTSDLSAKEIRLFGLQDFLQLLYRKYFHQLYEKEKELNKYKVVSALTIDPLLALVRPGLVAFVAFKAFLGVISLGRYSLYTQAITQLETSLYSLMYTLSQLYENNLFMDRLFRFLDLQPVVEAISQDAVTVAGPEQFSLPPTIEFCDVSFHYPDSQRPVIDHMSFRIEPGETVALVGENGAGKTTLVKLLAGLYKPTGGRILLNGIDITTMNKKLLRACLSVIFQDYSIYHLSVYDNIGFGDVESIQDHVRIEKAARQSGVDRIHMPQGYETILGRWIERGHELSGGQRQLVALARAIMRQAPVLILDEPSASLDIHKERAFFQSLFEQHSKKQQTIIFISHRFSSVKHADHIIMLGSGTVLEEGNHAQLMERGGHYARLFTMQVRTYEESLPPQELEHA